MRVVLIGVSDPDLTRAKSAADIAARAAAAGLFVAVPYVIRYSPLIEAIQSMNEPVQYASFKFIDWIASTSRRSSGSSIARPPAVVRC